MARQELIHFRYLDLKPRSEDDGGRALRACYLIWWSSVSCECAMPQATILADIVTSVRLDRLDIR